MNKGQIFYLGQSVREKDVGCLDGVDVTNIYFRVA